MMFTAANGTVRRTFSTATNSLLALASSLLLLMSSHPKKVELGTTFKDYRV